MIRTKEIDVYVHQGFLDKGWDCMSVMERSTPPEFTLKAKLLIEIPEKKITITESQFDAAISRASGMAVNYNYVNDIKKELGFINGD